MRLMIAGTLLGLFVATGCTSTNKSAPDETDTSGTAATAAPAPDPGAVIYLIDRGSRNLKGVSADILTDSLKPPELLAGIAVERLMAAESRGPQYDNLWSDICRVGSGVKSVQIRPSVPLVVVTLTGGVGGATCDISPTGVENRRQQLAWTVVKNSGVDDSTPVRVQSVSGSKMLGADIVPDRTLLAD